MIDYLVSNAIRLQIYVFSATEANFCCFFFLKCGLYRLAAPDGTDYTDACPRVFCVNKNLKNPAASSEAVGHSCLFRLSVPKSELSHNSLNIHGDVTSLSRLVVAREKRID